jgi:hypothetical protein
MGLDVSSETLLWFEAELNHGFDQSVRVASKRGNDLEYRTVRCTIYLSGVPVVKCSEKRTLATRDRKISGQVALIVGKEEKLRRTGCRVGG